MTTRTVEQIDSWSTVPFSGGYGGLHDLSDSEFSGAVIAGPARLFMLNGKVVGILDGSIDDFEDADGTAREAPHPGLPLLAVMQERSDEVRAKYYTEDTPIADVDETLSSGGFTGYVELSENVLSGDYYQIYHQGRSMSVAWVGNSDQLLTEDEAFERANDEVGIYEVRPVDIDIIDVPEPAEPEREDAADDSLDAGAGAAADVSDSPANDPEADESDETADDTQASDDTQPTGSSDSTAEPVDATPTEPREASSNDRPGRDETDRTASSETEPDRRTEAEPSESTPERGSSRAETPSGDTASGGRGRPSDRPDGPARTEQPTEPEPTRTQSPDSTGRPEERASPDSDSRRSDASVGGRAEPVDEPRREESTEDDNESSAVGPAPHDPSASATTDLETRSIPSLDPSHSGTASNSTPSSSDGRTQQEPRSRQSTAPQSDAGTRQQAVAREQERESGSQRGDAPQSREQTQQSQRDHPGAPAEQEPSQRAARSQADDQQASARDDPPQSEPDTASSDRIAELEDALAETESERDELESELDSLASERDELREKLDDARAEIERLESQLAEATTTETPDAETRLNRREAIDQTNLFVRYNSKGDATLEAVHSGNAERSAVDDNLRLEYHTQFDAETAAVGGQEFEAFLTESIQYRFVDWLVRNLLYEIRDTGNPDTMAGLFDALPKIDRAELNGQVTVEYTENGEQQRSQEQFDVVVRDRMGNPLIVANINDSRDPATDDMMTDLITRAERVGSSSDSLAGAFLVTESFFEPPALETAEEATSSGLLSRDKRKSFVNLSRKDGYHLCLVEARNQEFHLAVPEL